MSVGEAARVLAISRSYAYELVASGFLSSVRLGRRVLVPLSAVDDLLARSQDDF
ncbi:MAG TPA: excisionase family DNA-binding protein [Acidimicrobiales bacterium]|nr:excisionase family DNA-binding protein [Acidimicrobiales bacterium]